MLRLFALLLVAALIDPSPGLAAKKKKKKDEKEITQVLELPKDPPHAVSAEVQRLVFHVSPLSAKGLLSQQVRDGLKALFNANRGAAIVKLRAFVSGTGDQRRVQAIVSEEFAEKRLNLPALTVVQVGALPLEGAQVVIESIAVEKRLVNPHGVAFISGQPATASDAAAPLLKAAAQATVQAENVRRVTCFLDSLDNVATVRTQIITAFPKASGNYVQLQRGSIGDFVECEAVAALTKEPQAPAMYAGAMEGRYSQTALVAPGKVVLSGTQLAFGQEEKDLRLAFDRLKKALVGSGGDLERVVMTNLYPLSKPAAELTRKIRFDYYSRKTPPASTLLLFEGLPSLDASMAIDVVTLGR